MKKIKHEILFEWYAVRAKARKLKQLYRIWREWCRQFDQNYGKIFDKHFEETNHE